MTIAPMQAQAANPSAGDDWQFTAGAYLWGATIKGEAASGSDFDISFDDLINNLNMAFTGDFEARKSKWLFAADVIYLNVEADAGGQVLFLTMRYADQGRTTIADPPRRYQSR